MNKVFYYILAFAVILSSCKDDDDNELNVSQNSLIFTIDEGSSTLDVSSNTSWVVSSSDSWCSISPVSGTNNGKVTVSVSDNETSNERVAVVTIKSDGVPDQVVVVTQTGIRGKLPVAILFGSQKVVEYNYDDRNRLTKHTNYEVEDINDVEEITEFFYDESNSLVKVTEVLSGEYNRETLISKSGNGVRLDITSQNSRNGSISKFTKLIHLYMTTGLPVTMSEYFGTNIDTNDYTLYEYEYDDRKNLTSIAEYFVTESGRVLNETKEFESDDKVGIFRQIQNLKWWGVYSDDLLNSIHNNATKRTTIWVENRSVTNFKYEYDVIGYPQKITIKEDDEDANTFTIEYKKW